MDWLFPYSMEGRGCSVLCIFITLLLLLQKGSGNAQPCDPQTDAQCASDAHTKQRMERVATGYCPDGWYTFGEKCYLAFGSSSQKRNWNGAVSSCESVDANLVSIHTAEEQDFLNMIMMDIRSDIWIGLRRSTYSTSFSWKDSSSLDFLNWAEGEPNNYKTQEECVNMRYDSYGFGKWNDAPCGFRMAYICEKFKVMGLAGPGRNPGLCTQPQNWLKMKNSCYKVFEESKSYSSWSQAQSLCKSYNGNLAYVKDMAATALLRLNLPKHQGPFWIGIKSTKRHKYTRLGGNEPLVYSNWQSDQPTAELQNEENCVALNSDGDWMVRDCDERHPFICEIVVLGISPAAPTLEPYHPNMTCPSPKWHDLGGRYCYIIEINGISTWHEASCICAQEGGFLASFHSMKEINVITHYVKHYNMPLHIGFERDTKGRFRWSDGSPTDFTNWNSGEPNDVKEQCAEIKISTGTWNDIPCAARHGYICSALKVPVLEKNETVLSEISEARKHELNTKSHLGTVAVMLIVIAFVVALSAFAVYRFRHARMGKTT